MSDRDAFRANREAGLRARHETREARAIRKAVSEEIAQAIEALDGPMTGENTTSDYLVLAARIAREIGTKETQP